MSLFDNLNVKSIVYGIVIIVVCILLGYRFNDLFYPFAAFGLLYAGYKSTNIKQSVVVGCICAIPIVILSFLGYLGSFSGFFETALGLVVLVVVILLVGAFVGFVGGWAKRDRMKALEEYNRKNSKGKKKK